MLRRNGLISEADQRRLTGWLDALAYAVAMLLDGMPVEDALVPYRQLADDAQHPRALAD